MSDPQIRSILLDVEGTTTPFEFVHEVLFPFARKHIKDFLFRHYSDEQVSSDIERLKEEFAADVGIGLDPPLWHDSPTQWDIESAIGYVYWLMDADRKSTALKSLQGRVWEAGYRTGALRAPVYRDVPAAFERWKMQKKVVSIFSSGSILAQKLLFAHTTEGDLTGYITDYFDTTTGAKGDEGSYQRIAASLGLSPQDILFVSDVTAELDAARRAGMETALCVRPGRPQPESSLHPTIRSFDEIFPERA